MARKKHDPAYDDKLREIGGRLRAIREANDLNQEEAASLVGVSRRQWISWEFGQVTLSAWAILELMLKLDIDPGWVLGGPGDEPLLRSDESSDTRFRRVMKAVRAMVADLGLRIPEMSVRRLAILIIRKPEEAEMEERKRVREMLRALANGKKG